MSKLTDIKYRIDQLDGGPFQNLCDEYLICKGYEKVYSLGMKTGTNKTATGNPDTYSFTREGKCVFAMYTTQKESFLKKAFEDLEKCFDSSKTGLLPKDISEIVYCHTCGRLLPGEIQRLNKLCEDKNVSLTLIGLDELGNEIYLKYPRIAKDILNISVDSGQITSMREFIQIHDANKMSAPLSTEFMLRDEELKAAKEKLALSDVLVLSGAAGVGKTRIALKLCEEIASENQYEVLCIKSNGLDLYDDLISYVEPDKNYLVFVDDANELTGLHFVLDLLSKAAIGNRRIKKIIVTVRDYARQWVVQQILEVEKPEILKIEILKDGEIRKLIEAAYGITNHLFSDRIVEIAEGNARLAMLAGKVAVEAESINSIRDATELYEHYYGMQIEKIAHSETGIASAGIMAFFQALRLDNLVRLQPIFDAIRVTESQFISDLKQFHALELVDLRHDTAVKISDQSFSNYLIKYVFVDKKIIPLSKMIKDGFSINKEKIITACNILINVFSDKAVQDYVEEQVKIVWDELQSDLDNFWPFLRAFYMVRPTETLVLLSKKIELETACDFDIHTITFKKGTEKSIDDDIISILCGYKENSLLPEAIELLLVYYQKRPDLFEQIYSAFVTCFGVDKDALYFEFITQKIVVERLCAAVESDHTDELLILFVRVAEQYLKLSFSRTEGGRKNTITFYTIPLMLHKTVLEYRRMLLREIYLIYKDGKCHEEIEGLLMDYCNEYGKGENYEIVKEEFDCVLSFFELLLPEKLLHCAIAEHIEKVARRAKQDYGDIFAPFLESHKYRVFKVLNANDSEELQMDYQEYEQWRKKQILEMVREYNLQDVQFMFQVCRECSNEVDDGDRMLSFGIECAIEAFAGNPEMYIRVVNEYLKSGTPYNIYAGGILRYLFSMMPAEDIKALICSHDFLQKNTWMWSFYYEMPEEQISLAWETDFLKYLEDVPQNKVLSPNRPIDKMEKYETADKDFILKASRVIALHYDESPFLFSLYFSHMMNPHCTKAGTIIAKFKNDLHLLEEIYLKCVEYSYHEDYDGHFLAEIILNDTGFLYCYLDKLIEKINHTYSACDRWAGRLVFVWTSDVFAPYMDLISDYIFEKDNKGTWIYRSVVSKLLLHKTGETAVTKKQEKWIHGTIEKYCLDQRHMYGLFGAIDEQSATCRRNALEKLLQLNDDYALFEKLPLEKSSWGGWGSLIPHMQARIEYLTSLFPLLSGAKFLLHRQRLEREIEMWRNRIRNEEIRELFESLG